MSEQLIEEPKVQENMTCDLCGSHSFSLVSNLDRHGQALKTGICRGCGLVMHMPVPSEDEVAAYYAEHYRRDYHGETTPSNRRIMRAWKNGERIYRQICPFIPKHGRLFEVGAGIGCTVKAFETHGFDASGIEPNKDFNRFTREKLKANVENRNLYDLDTKDAYDVVILIHVIEHFSSPTRALEHIHGLLKENGQLYVECPNLTGPFATFGRMFHFAHIYNFSPNTLIALAQKCGFIVEERFTDEDNPNIEILFRKSTPQAPEIDPGRADWVLGRILHFNVFTYNLRPNYIYRRICKLSSYAREHLTANGFVARLLERFKG